VRHIRSFLRFWWDFIVGDEWRIAVIVTVVTVVAWLAAHGAWVDGEIIACTVGVVVMAAVCVVVIDAGRHGRS